MRGLGDNIYQRAFVRNLGECWIDTPWPELYEDLPGVRVGCAGTALRTQAKNLARQVPGWQSPLPAAPAKRIWYGEQTSIVQAMRRLFGVAPQWGLPSFDDPRVCAAERVAVVRPVTVRTEYRNEARNPQPEYVAEAAAELRRRGYTVVSVADLAPGEEWALEPLPPADLTLHAGELDVRQLLGLVSRAAVCVGGVGWIAPACLSAGVPFYGILGGHGGLNAPEKITDSSMDLSRVGWAVPVNFCRCTEKGHKCDKRIDGFADKFARWLDACAL